MHVPRSRFDEEFANSHPAETPSAHEASQTRARPADPRATGQVPNTSAERKVFLPQWQDVRALLAITLAAIVVALWWWWSGQPQEPASAASATVKSASDSSEQRAQPTPASSLQPLHSPGEASAPPSGALITVDIRGAVTRRGIQQLPAGSRVIDAIRAAGGVRPGRAYGAVNLAKLLDDGEQIHVGKADPDSTPPDLSAVPSGTGAGTGPVNINTAAETALEALPGVGPVLAGRIVDWRQQNGAFRSVDDLLQVVGIGDKVLEGLRPEVTIT